jgi:AcrR family transcriptional regulator
VPMRAARRRRLEPEVRRQEVIEAAEKLLTVNGVEDIVHEAGAAKGTFYLYFPTWDDLLEAIRGRLVVAFGEVRERVLAAMRRILRRTLAPEAE